MKTLTIIFFSSLAGQLIVTNQASAIEWNGVWGDEMGSWSPSAPAATLFLASSEHIVGLFGHSGTLIDYLGFIGESGRYSGTIGGTGGGPYELRCPLGTFAVGFQGTVGRNNMVRGVSLVCREPGHSTELMTGWAGDDFGNYYYSCPPNTYLRAFWAQAGDQPGKSGRFYRTVTYLQPYCE